MFSTVKQTAVFLNLSVRQVYHLIFMNKIEAIKIGTIWRVVSDSAKEYKTNIAA